MADDPHARLKAELKAIPKAELKRFWRDLGYILLPAAPEWLDRPATALQEQRLLEATSAALHQDLVTAGLLTSDAAGKVTAADLTKRFYDLAPRSPVTAKKGGNGFNGSLQIFALASLLQPKVVIESGVFRGQTTWVLRQACPSASIFCFDVDLSNLVYKDREAIYSEADWAEFDLSSLPTADTLAFFDDHIDQGRRVLEAKQRGIKQLLFDDNASATRIHTVGGPPIPSLDMLMDPSLDSQVLEWNYRGKRYGCSIEANQAQQVRNTVVQMHNFADMHSVTGYTPARITYVSLR